MRWAPRVFIINAAEDEGRAREICRGLEDREISCLRPARDLRAGADWRREIEDAIASCAAVIVLVSKRSNESEAVSFEIRIACSYGKVVLPVRLEGISPSQTILRPWQWIDLPQIGPSELDALSIRLRRMLPEASLTAILPDSAARADGIMGTQSEGNRQPTMARNEGRMPHENDRPVGSRRFSLPQHLRRLKQRLSPHALPFRSVDNVHFSVSAPTQVKPASSFILEFWAHQGHAMERVIELARKSSPGTEIQVRSKGPIRLRRGTVVSVVLEIEELEY